MTAQSSRPPRHGSRINPQIFSLIAVSLFAHVTMSGGRVSASLFALQGGHGEAMAGVAYSLYCLLPALLSLHMGRWIDKVGPRRVMHISLALMIAGLLLPVVYVSLPMVLLTAALSGFGFGSYMLAANVAVSYMRLEQESDRVGMLAWLQMGNSVSAVVGPSMSGLMIDHFGFRAAFGLLAVIVMGSMALSYRVDLPDSVHDRKQQASGQGVMRAVFSDPKLLRIYLLAMTVSMSSDGFAFMAPVLGHERGYTATQVGLVLSAFAAGTFAIRIVLPWLSRRLPEWRMLAIAFALTAAVFFLLPLAHDSLVHAALGFAFGLAAGVGQPNILNLIYRAMPDGKQGEGAGLRSMMGNFMGLTGPSVYGAISSLFGAVPVFLIIACVMSVSSWQANKGYRLAHDAPATV